MEATVLVTLVLGVVAAMIGGNSSVAFARMSVMAAAVLVIIGVGACRVGNERVGRLCGRRGCRCWKRPGRVADPLSRSLTLV